MFKIIAITASILSLASSSTTQGFPFVKEDLIEATKTFKAFHSVEGKLHANIISQYAGLPLSKEAEPCAHLKAPSAKTGCYLAVWAHLKKRDDDFRYAIQLLSGSLGLQEADRSALLARYVSDHDRLKLTFGAPEHHEASTDPSVNEKNLKSYLDEVLYCTNLVSKEHIGFFDGTFGSPLKFMGVWRDWVSHIPPKRHNEGIFSQRYIIGKIKLNKMHYLKIK